MRDYSDYLKRLPFYERLSESEKRMIEEGWSQKTYKKGQIIYNSNDACLGHIYLCEGEVRAYVTSEEGREITLFRLFSDDTCILSASCVLNQIKFDSQLIAVTDVSMLVLNSSIFNTLCEQNVYVKLYAYELLSSRFSSIMWAMQQIVFMKFDRRLAIFLVSEYKRTGKKTVKMTHEQIAEHTNSAREVVARTLKKLSNDSLIEYKRGCVTIKELEALSLLAETR